MQGAEEECGIRIRSEIALLKTSPRPPENHEIVREHAEHELACLREQAPRAERRAEAALVPTEDALGVPALVVERPRKLPPQGAPIRRCGPPAGAPRIERDHTVRDPQRVAAEAVVRLGVVGRVGQDGVEGQERRGLAQRGREIGRVVGGPRAGHGPEDQMRVDVGDRRELRPRPVLVGAPWVVVRAPDAVVEADVPRFEPRGVDRDDRGRLDEAGADRARDDDVLGAPKGAPFSASASSRRSA